MILDVKKAFTFVFEDPHWVKKILVGGGITFSLGILGFLQGAVCGYIKLQGSNPLGLTVIFKIIELLVFSFVIGYLVVYANKQIHNQSDPQTVLPEWKSNFANFFKKGLILYSIELVYAFLLWLFIVLSSVAIFVSAAKFGFQPLLIKENPSMLLQPEIIIPFFVLFVFCVLYSFIITFAKFSYADNLKFKDAFNLGRIFSLFSKTIPEMLYYFVISIGLIIAYCLIILLLAVTLVGIPFIPFFCFYICLVFYNLYIQLYKKGCERITQVS